MILLLPNELVPQNSANYGDRVYKESSVSLFAAAIAVLAFCCDLL